MMLPTLTRQACMMLALASACLWTARSQGRPDSAAKPVPTVRTVPVPEAAVPMLQDSSRAPGVPLPKIDLPEYVITGASAIDLAIGDKPIAEDVSVPAGPLYRAGRSLSRDILSTPGMLRPSMPGATPLPSFRGRAFAGMGTFFTPVLGIWLGQQRDGYQLDGDAGYSRTKGWTTNAERSGARLSARISTMLTGDSPFIQDTQIGGMVGYATDRYRFYGSRTPTTERTVSGLNLAVAMQNLSNAEVPYSILLRNHSREILDSSWSTKQNEFSFGLMSRFEGAGLPWEVGFLYESAAVSGLRGGTLSRLDVSVETSWPWNTALFRASVHVGAVRGLGGQELTRFYPNLRASVPVGGGHVLLAGFAPFLWYRTLADEITERPYLSAQTPVRHTDVRQRWELGLQSVWSAQVETRASVTYESMGERPYPVDTAHIGVWDLAYSGNATVVTFRAEAVAKLTRNDYFVPGILIRSADHSDIGRSVPYDPEVEFGVVYRGRLGEAVHISPAIQFVSRRAASPSGSPRLPELLRVDLRVEYAGWEGIRLILDATNILDRRQETWLGYLDRPFTIALGVDVRW